MNNTELITGLLRLFAGMGVFLMACDTMSKNLQAISSDKLKKLFYKVSDKKLIGVMIGALVTVAIQSSGATTVMTIGFVNAGIISLNQAATIIFGGEIGTTITGQIVALGMFSGGGIDTDVLFASLAGVGAFINMFAKSDKQKLLGKVLAGIGMLFVGLNIMSGSMKSFAQTEGLKMFLASIRSEFLLIIVGALLTGLIQSSSVITSVAITMIVNGLINIEQGIYLTLGANIGSCLTGMLAGMKSDSINAKRTSLLQLIFNIGGVMILYFIDMFLQGTTRGTFSFAILFERMFPGLPHTQLAMFHTAFNVASVLCVLPISDALVRLTQKLIKDDGRQVGETRFHYVDENMIATPSIAVSQIKKEIINMAYIAIENFNLAMEMIKKVDLSEKEKFEANEKELNFLNRALVDFAAKLTGKHNIDKNDYLYLLSTYRTIADFERIGDYSENIMEYAEALKESGESFSEDIIKQIDELDDLINHLCDVTIEVYTGAVSRDNKAAEQLEESIDVLTTKMSEDHIQRMNKGDFSANVGAQYLKLARDVERIGDHLMNINTKDYIVSH